MLQEIRCNRGLGSPYRRGLQRVQGSRRRVRARARHAGKTELNLPKPTCETDHFRQKNERNLRAG